MKQAVVGILAAGAAVAWLLAAISGFAMLRHLAPHRTLGWMVFHGIAWFDPDNFTPAAAPWRRRFVAGFVAFFVCVLGAIAVGALLS